MFAAVGIDETAGYVGVAVGAFATALIGDAYGLRPQPFYVVRDAVAVSPKLPATFLDCNVCVLRCTAS
jgi:hypothetical protein